MTPEEKAAERARVKAVLESLHAAAPGHSVELRIPPYAAIQLIEGPRHTRGTPAAVVEMDAATLFALDARELTWEDGVQAGRILASGERSNLSHLFH